MRHFIFPYSHLYITFSWSNRYYGLYTVYIQWQEHYGSHTKFMLLTYVVHTACDREHPLVFSSSQYRMKLKFNVSFYYPSDMF